MSSTFRATEGQPAVRTFDKTGVYGDELGPFASFVGQIVVFLGFIVAFKPFDGIPGKSAYVVLIAAIGVLLLAPRNSVKRLPISLSLLAFLALMLFSVVWTVNPAGSAFNLKTSVPLLLSFSIVIGLLKFEHMMTAIIWAIRVALLVSIVAVAIDPEARAHFGERFGDEPLPGWHGWFSHKNAMAPYFAFGALTVLMFDRNQLAKWFTVSGLAFMIVMSDSLTGLFAFVLVLGVWWWLEQFARLDERNGVMFFASTFGLGLLAILGGVASTTTVLSFAGKDATLAGRTDIWAASFDAFLERPIFGYGINGLFWNDPPTIELIETWRSVGFQAFHPHQGLLAIAVDLGLVGVALYFGLFYSTFKGGWGLIRTNPKIGFWVVAMMSGQIFMSVSENAFTGRWLLIVLIFRLVSLRRHGMEFAERGTRAKRRQLVR